MKGNTVKIVNKKALFDYSILDRFEAGVALLGWEVKSLREGHAKLEGAFVRLTNEGPVLVNAEIFPYKFARPEGQDPKRTRHLLLHKRELVAVQGKLSGQNLTLVPLSWYTTGHRVKLEIGLARGKKQYEKRDIIKAREEKRDLEKRFRRG